MSISIVMLKGITFKDQVLVTEPLEDIGARDGASRVKHTRVF
jgi:hypothetical protein